MPTSTGWVQSRYWPEDLHPGPISENQKEKLLSLSPCVPSLNLACGGSSAVD